MVQHQSLCQLQLSMFLTDLVAQVALSREAPGRHFSPVFAPNAAQERPPGRGKPPPGFTTAQYSAASGQLHSGFRTNSGQLHSGRTTPAGSRPSSNHGSIEGTSSAGLQEQQAVPGKAVHSLHDLDYILLALAGFVLASQC